MRTRRPLVRERVRPTTVCCPYCGGAAIVTVHASGSVGTECVCRWWRFESVDGVVEEEDDRFLEWLHGGDDPLERLDRPLPSLERVPDALPSWDEIVEYRTAS